MDLNRKIFGINPKSNGSELKDLSDAVIHIIKMIKLVGNKKVMNAKEYVK